MITKNRISESIAQRLNIQSDINVQELKISNNSSKTIAEIKVNGIRCMFQVKMSSNMIQDLSFIGISANLEIENILQEEIINYYVNNLKFKRKLKLDKLNKIKYEIFI